MIEIRRCTVAQIEAAPNLAAVLAEYAAESSQAELGPVRPQFATYRGLEATGFFHPIGAFEGERLAGFILPIVIALPHYGVLAATVESFFVPAADRPSGAGLKLLAMAEELARALGAKGLILSAPVGSVLSKLMEKMPAYRHSNEVFIRGFA